MLILSQRQLHCGSSFSASSRSCYSDAEHIFYCPRLRVFSLNKIRQNTSLIGPRAFLTQFVDHALLGMQRLVRLDLSGCEVYPECMEEGLSRLHCLQDLNLTNVDLEPLAENLRVIGTVKSLRFLSLLFDFLFLVVFCILYFV